MFFGPARTLVLASPCGWDGVLLLFLQRIHTQSAKSTARDRSISVQLLTFSDWFNFAKSVWIRRSTRMHSASTWDGRNLTTSLIVSIAETMLSYVQCRCSYVFDTCGIFNGRYGPKLCVLTCKALGFQKPCNDGHPNHRDEPASIKYTNR